MEFFTQTASTWDEQGLKAALSMADLPKWCEAIEAHLESDEAASWGRYDTIWGVFEITRMPIRGGYRYLLPHCPNALTWSVTTGLPPDLDAVVVHATINRENHEPDFIESLEEFVDAWRVGIGRMAEASAAD
ncbi:hypothetical protein [Magnetofaba australis]|uniref:Uncharacterized protein n=1 Tax=Magnetofaba australis IT-1 TaxID=1434232 RepID=A0A1Y2K6C5_9PROT|nr:hypothetical protein [Magnetofaba australis]OSM03981.1 hypothetical protein MAIT1_03770 [Magnetofaba australis IT-1]